MLIVVKNINNSHLTNEFQVDCETECDKQFCGKQQIIFMALGKILKQGTENETYKRCLT